MNRILKIGMDVHKKSFSLCIIEPSLDSEEHVLLQHVVPADYKEVIKVINRLKEKLGSQNTYDIQCGYEAGCWGVSLYHQLNDAGVKCVIIAPTTMLTQQGVRVKTDARDALVIAKCLAYGTYSPVYVPTDKDNAVKEFLRMRDAQKRTLKKRKQQIITFCTRLGYVYEGRNWTMPHWKWLKSLVFSDPLLRETLDEYMASLEELIAKIERLDVRIEELAADPEYAMKVKQLICFLGIKTHTALSLIVETGDFKRFSKGSTYASYLGLAPGEHSSGEHIQRTGISKAGNAHLRRLLVESGQSICRGKPGAKSKALKARQAGNKSEVIAYADKGNYRLRRKYYRLISHGKSRNVAVAAVARELACFVWGMMTENIGMRESDLKRA